MKEKMVKQIELIKGLLDTIDFEENNSLTINTLGSVKGLMDNIMYKLVDEQTKNCDHPESYRLNLTSLGGKEEWECKLCEFHYIEE